MEMFSNQALAAAALIICCSAGVLFLLASKSPNTKVFLLSSLAKIGSAEAQCGLGGLYYEGLGVDQNYKEAAKWIRKAAEQGEAEAQFYLGFIYYIGQGVPQDYKEAEKWYRKAAEQGYAKAQAMLGVLYYKGQGVPEDKIEALKWLIIAAAKGNKDDIEARDKLNSVLSNSQVEEAQRRAREFKPAKQIQP